MPQEEEKGKGPALPFRNDGSFLEQFMKMQQAQAGSAPENIATNINNTASDLSHDKTNDAEEKDNQDDLAKTDADGSDDDKTKPSEDNAEAPAAAAAAPKPGPFAKFAKKSSGAVKRPGSGSDSSRKKQKDEPPEGSENPAWQAYMKEVEKYKNASCTEERENRPLVK